MRRKNSSSRRRSNITTNKNGYSVFKDTGKPVHRSVAEKKLGRPLRKGEVVHHIDRNKTNNAPSNLYVFGSQKQHSAAHNIDAKRYGNIYSYKGKNNT